MSFFKTELAAYDWARNYGSAYTYRVVRAVGLFIVQWNYREPAGC